jgi:hypothetical protein
MSFDLEKLKNISEWEPKQRDIEWTRNFLHSRTIKAKNDAFVWVTNDYSIEFKNMLANITDINFNIKTKPRDTYENLSRIVKVLEKLNYTINMPEHKSVINLDQNTRLIPNIGVIDKNMEIQTAKYEDKF